MNDHDSDCEVRFIADDFGLSDAVNDAILRAHLDGALHGACLMMGQPGTAHAIELARAHPSLAIGWHLHLCDSRPTTTDRWPWGASPARAGWTMAVSPGARALARREIHQQWRLMRETGLRVETANTHHHLHWHPFVRRALDEVLAADSGFDGWVRWGAPRFFEGRTPLGYALVESLLQAPARRRLSWRGSDTLWGIDRTFRMDAEEIRGTVDGLPEGLHEFMFHPRPGPNDPDTLCLIALGRMASAEGSGR